MLGTVHKSCWLCDKSHVLIRLFGVTPFGVFFSFFNYHNLLLNWASLFIVRMWNVSIVRFLQVFAYVFEIIWTKNQQNFDSIFKMILCSIKRKCEFVEYTIQYIYINSFDTWMRCQVTLFYFLHTIKWILSKSNRSHKAYVVQNVIEWGVNTD